MQGYLLNCIICKEQGVSPVPHSYPMCPRCEGRCAKEIGNPLVAKLESVCPHKPTGYAAMEGKTWNPDMGKGKLWLP